MIREVLAQWRIEKRRIFLMSHLHITTDYFASQQQSVDDGKSTLIGRLLTILKASFKIN